MDLDLGYMITSLFFQVASRLMLGLYGWWWVHGCAVQKISGLYQVCVMHQHPFLFSSFYLCSSWRSFLITGILTSHGVLLDKACVQWHQSKSLHNQCTHIGAEPGPLKGHASCVVPSGLGPHEIICFMLYIALNLYFTQNINILVFLNICKFASLRVGVCTRVPWTLHDPHHVVAPLTSIMWFLSHLLDFSFIIGDRDWRQDIKIH